MFGWLRKKPENAPATGADGNAPPVKPVEEWRPSLSVLDEVSCARSRLTFCGRPWMTFFVDLDASRRVRQVGPLQVSAE